MRWSELLAELGKSIEEHEARTVVAEVSRMPYAELYLHRFSRADSDAISKARRLAKRCAAGEPLQIVIGHWGFRYLDVIVDRRALIPRPETEIVVEHAIEELARLRRAGRSDLVALDLGTGSGVIACSLALEVPDATVIATDISPDALALAAANRARLGTGAARVVLLEADWYEAFAEGARRVDCIVANPPYLSTSEWEEAPPIVRDFDPATALIGGVVGTEMLEQVVAGASALLVEQGALVMEIGADQAEAAEALAHKAGASSVEIAPDLAERPRVLIARW